MTIGRHALSIRATIRRPCSMRAVRVSRWRHCASSSRYLTVARTPRRATMTYDPDGVLWNRRMELRFAPRPTPSTNDPTLNVARFTNNASENTEAHEDAQLKPWAVAEQDDQLDDALLAGVFDGLSISDDVKKPIDKKAIPDPAVVGTGNARVESLEVAPKFDAPPLTHLPYKIPLERFRQARDSAKGSPGSYWAHTLYQRTNDDGTKANVRVHYCTTKHNMEYVCQKYFANEKVLGMDLEWHPGATRNSDARHGVSLIQMASPGHIGLFHCAMFSKDDFIAPTFRKIMGDISVSKVGANIKGDCTRLKTYMDVDTRGIFELSHMYKMVKYIKLGQLNRIDKYAVPLATQVEEYLGLPLRKGEDVRLSDWTRFLSGQQILYAASDAYAGLQLYYVLDEERQKLDPCPPRPHFAEEGLRIPTPRPNIAQRGDDLDTEGAPSPSRATRRTANPVSSFQDARVAAADLKMQEYRASKTGSISVGPSALRAYYVWHANVTLKPEDIAKLLREPPLQTNTVVSYILDAVAGENMPYSKVRLKAEVLSFLAPNATKKFESLIKACEDAVNDVPS